MMPIKMLKEFDDMYNRLDAVPALSRQMDRKYRALYALHADARWKYAKISMLSSTEKGSLGSKSILNIPIHRNRCFWNYPSIVRRM